MIDEQVRRIFDVFAFVCPAELAPALACTGVSSMPLRSELIAGRESPVKTRDGFPWVLKTLREHMQAIRGIQCINCLQFHLLPQENCYYGHGQTSNRNIRTKPFSYYCKSSKQPYAFEKEWNKSYIPVNPGFFGSIYDGKRGRRYVAVQTANNNTVRRD